MCFYGRCVRANTLCLLADKASIPEADALRGWTPDPSEAASSSISPSRPRGPTAAPHQLYRDPALAASSSSSSSSAPPQHKAWDILERLEQLEIQQAQRVDEADEPAFEDHQILVTTHQQNFGLTKNVRLPDAILIPENE